MTVYNIYCDESCYQEHDQSKVMVLGAIYCPQEKCSGIASDLRAIKRRHGLAPETFEAKWTKVSSSKEDYYLDVVRYFFEKPELRFRGLLVPDKSKLRHEAFNQDHSKWYFKMFFYLLRVIVDPRDQFNVYLDIKDTRSRERVAFLGEVLANDMLDFQKNSIKNIQTVRSHEIEIMQVVDLLIGAIGYKNRDYDTNTGKLTVIRTVEDLSGADLKSGTGLSATKFNLFKWHPREET